MIGMIETLTVNKDMMLGALQKGYPTATDLADYLVTNLHFPFRDAHEITGKIVLLAEKKQCPLEKLTLEELRKIESNLN